MDLITILEENIKKNDQKNWGIFLNVQKFLVEQHFDWLTLQIHKKSKSLIGRGILNVKGKSYPVVFSYSPFHKHRYDRIYIEDKSIKYNEYIHVYRDLSLCLYHPLIDQPLFHIIPLFRMVPWISEWIIYYEQWKKYGVWLGKEIMHESG